MIDNSLLNSYKKFSPFGLKMAELKGQKRIPKYDMRTIFGTELAEISLFFNETKLFDCVINFHIYALQMSA